ncbi:hypothetical protein AVEN_240866-1 [Araneus ventricosus]|uniref:Uncharacterized protein n=1 Tax=Araneus ventricosus TaxID=182803 RepID=A0A4Y2MN84_ARAVE|nr:hypothetical protein AVEN_240866-1 [Araneus ventricosus]
MQTLFKIPAIRQKDASIQFDSSPKELVQPRIWLQSRGQKTPVPPKFRFRKPHHGEALCVFSSQLSLSLFPDRLPFLNTYPQSPGVGGIRPSVGQTTRQQSGTFLPGYHWKQSTLNCPSLSPPLLGSTQMLPLSLSLEPLLVCVRPARFNDLFYGPYIFPLRRSGDLLCGPVVVGTRKGRPHNSPLKGFFFILRRKINFTRMTCSHYQQRQITNLYTLKSLFLIFTIQ